MEKQQNNVFILSKQQFINDAKVRLYKNYVKNHFTNQAIAIEYEFKNEKLGACKETFLNEMLQQYINPKDFNQKIQEYKFKKFPNGDYYYGGWKNNKPEGKGIQKSLDGEIYEGDWKDGKPEGKGTWKWPDGEIYEGDWKDGKPEGKMVLKYPDGEICEQCWKNGELISFNIILSNLDQTNSQSQTKKSTQQ